MLREDIISKLNDIINSLEKSKDDVRSLRDYRGRVLDPYRQFISFVVNSYQNRDQNAVAAVDSFKLGLDYRRRILAAGLSSLSHSEFLEAITQDQLFFLWTGLYGPFGEFCSLQKNIGEVEDHCRLARKGCCAGITVFDIRDPDYKTLFLQLFPENTNRQAMPCHCDDWEKAGRTYGQFASVDRDRNYCATAGIAVCRMKRDGFARFIERLRNTRHFRL